MFNPAGVEAGFLVVKRFETLYREFAEDPTRSLRAYAFPVYGAQPEVAPVRYRGVDRDPVGHLRRDTAAEKRLLGLAQIGECVGDLILRKDAAEEVLALAGAGASDGDDAETSGTYELIWAGKAHAEDTEPPASFQRLGFEPAELAGSNFSAVCETMCFPRGKVPDVDGLLFQGYFEELNASGLFSTQAMAQEFLDYYQSFAWAAQGGLVVTEVWDPRG